MLFTRLIEEQCRVGMRSPVTYQLFPTMLTPLDSAIR